MYFLFVIIVVSVLPASFSWALTYECVDVAGHVIFTDSPSQLTQCATATSAAAASTSVSPRPVPNVVQPVAVLSLPVPNGPIGQVPGQIIIPVTKVGRSLVVQAKLNGLRDTKLIVDTGAEITVLSHAAALDAGLLPSMTVATVTLNTAGGSVRADVFRVGTVSLGTAEARDVTTVVHDLPDAPAGVEGLLGMTFLDKFLVTVDAQKGELHLKQRDTP